MAFDILCFGEPLYELSEIADASGYRPGFGGDTSNCAIAAARQGAKVGFFTALGTDAFGDAFMALWDREGVDATTVMRHHSAPTGVYFIHHGPAGHRFSYRRAGSAASLVTPEDVPEQVIAASRFLHVSGISQAISTCACDAVFHAIDIARRHGVEVSYDTNLRLQLWPLARARGIIREALRQCQIVLPGLEDAMQLTGLAQPEAIVEYFLGLGPSVVALTMGLAGTLVATREKHAHVAVFPVAAVDATAAGDTFDGAFLAELCAGRDPFTAAAYGNAAAALSTLGYGAVAPIPRRAAVEQLMAGCGR